MNGVKLYRKRLIPEECILLKDDHLFYQSPDILMTAWSALKPKPDLDHGISCYYLKEGFKISKFYDHQNRFMYWYCDIISHQYDKEENRYIFTDLLADVILYPDNRLRVIDLDELSLALSGGLLQKEDVCDALLKLDHLLRLYFQGLLKGYLDGIDRLTAQYWKE